MDSLVTNQESNGNLNVTLQNRVFPKLWKGISAAPDVEDAICYQVFKKRKCGMALVTVGCTTV